MAVSTLEQELETLPELEIGTESALEADRETEQFFDALRNLAGRAAGWVSQQATTQGSPLRRVAFGAAHAALRNAPKYLGGLGKTIGARYGLGGLGAAIGDVLGSGVKALDPLVPQSEYELEFEWEGEISPVRKWYADAMLEHLGHAVAEAESEMEAEALVGAMIPLAARVVPGAARVLARSAPGLICGAVGAARKLRQTPATRPLVRLIPAIVRRTAASLVQQAGHGMPVKPQQAVRTLARQTAQVLSSPQQAAQAFRHSQRLDRHFHKAANGRHVCMRCHKCGAKVR
jgi:hypothetical protein